MESGVSAVDVSPGTALSATIRDSVIRVVGFMYEAVPTILQLSAAAAENAIPTLII
jgi:hypothetical protein